MPTVSGHTSAIRAKQVIGTKVTEVFSDALLLQEFDGSTGIHLWCSVRRSGKTTAAQDLMADSPSSVDADQLDNLGIEIKKPKAAGEAS